MVITHTRVHQRRVGKYRTGHVALLGVVVGPAAGPRSGPGRGRARPGGWAPSAESASPHQKTVCDRDFQLLNGLHRERCNAGWLGTRRWVLTVQQEEDPSSLRKTLPLADLGRMRASHQIPKSIGRLRNSAGRWVDGEPFVSSSMRSRHRPARAGVATIGYCTRLVRVHQGGSPMPKQPASQSPGQPVSHRYSCQESPRTFRGKEVQPQENYQVSKNEVPGYVNHSGSECGAGQTRKRHNRIGQCSSSSTS